MTFDVTFLSGAILGFLLVVIRATSWMAVCPPFNAKAVPMRIKILSALGFGIFLYPTIDPTTIPVSTGPLLLAVLANVFLGLCLGFMVNFLFLAVQTAGEMVDVFGGISVNPAFDPTTGMSASGFARIYSSFANALIFGAGGHILLTRGLLHSFESIPVNIASFPIQAMKDQLISNIPVFVVAAVEIAAPAIAVSFLIEVAQGLIAKAAPQMNVMLAIMPLKILVAILATAIALPILPNAHANLLEKALRSMLEVFGG